MKMNLRLSAGLSRAGGKVQVPAAKGSAWFAFDSPTQKREKATEFVEEAR